MRHTFPCTNVVGDADVSTRHLPDDAVTMVNDNALAHLCKVMGSAGAGGTTVSIGTNGGADGAEGTTVSIGTNGGADGSLGETIRSIIRGAVTAGIII